MIWRLTPEHAALWDAVNRIVVASGGSSANTSVRRQKAVVEAESAVEAALVRARAEALRAAADLADRGSERGGWQDDAPLSGDVLPHEVADWLRAEADRIERGGK